MAMDDRVRSAALQPAADAAVVFERLPDAYLILDQHHYVALANAAYLRQRGEVGETPLGRSIYDINQFGPPAQRAARREWLEELLLDLAPGQTRSSPLLRYDMPARKAGGAQGNVTRWWQLVATNIAEENEPALIALRVAEMTREVQAQEEEQRERAKVRSQAQLRQMLVEEAREQLADNRQRFQVALAFAQIGAWELDPASGDIECTVQCKANYGLPPDAEFNERRLFEELIDPEDRQRVRQTMDQALAAHEHFEVDYRTTWPDGSQHWILVRGIGRHQADGSLAAVRGFTLDITHRKQRELEQQAIAAAEKQARQQSERAALAMDHFVTAVSHELRSPLNAILSWASLLRRSPDAAGVNRAAEVIDRNTRQLSHMVDDLLDGGAIATGKLSVKLEPVDVGALAGNVIEDMRMNAEAKGLRLVVDDLASCTVLGDVARLRQVLWNVLSNAMKFTPAGGEVRLAVRAQGAEVEVEVRDSGRGIEPQALERIFDRFQQYDNPGPGRVGGLGLGLWLVKNLVDLHHGSVGAHSEGAGRGATFRIRLPRYL